MTCVHFNVPFTPSNHINQVLTLCDAFRDLMPFVQFEKREKDPWRSVTFYKVAGCLQFSKSNTPSCFFFHVFLIVQIVPKCAKRLIYIYQLWANSLDTSCLLSDFIKNIGIFLLPQTFLAKMRFTSCNSIKDRLFNMHFPENFPNVYIFFFETSSGKQFLLIFFLLIVPCDHPDADYEQICGYGATGCLGNAIDPMCQCNIELQTKPSSNGSSCVPGKIFF